MSLHLPRELEPALRAAAARMPVVTVIGPRQAGKSTLCRRVFPDRVYVSLADAAARDFATTDPAGFLAAHRDGAVIDEVQLAPNLLLQIQAVVDGSRKKGQFVLTGSQVAALGGEVSQSLAGRTAVLRLLPMSRAEVALFPTAPTTLWETLFHGFFPRVYDEGLDPTQFFDSYVATYVERDVRQILRLSATNNFRNFVRILGGRTAQMLSLSQIANDVGVAHPTISAWLSVLEACFLTLRAEAWHGNPRRRYIKAPKLHLVDTGLVCYLLGIQSPDQLATHPLRGALFETYVAGEVAKAVLNRGEPLRLFHYRERGGREADLLIETARGRVLIETKSGQTVDAQAFARLAEIADAVAESGYPGALTQWIVHGGESGQVRTHATLLAWSAAAKAIG